MQVALRHRGTGNIRHVDTGWSWSIFLAAGFFGLPLYLRGLSFWGTVMVITWCLRLFLPTAAGSLASTAELQLYLSLAIGGLCFYLGFKGNALSARHYIACGYEFSEPDGTEARIASDEWGL